MATPASLSPWVDAGRLLGQRLREGVQHRPRLAQSLFVVAGTALLLTIILALPFSGAQPVSGDPGRSASSAPASPAPAPMAAPAPVPAAAPMADPAPPVTEPRLSLPLPEAPGVAPATADRGVMTDNTTNDVALPADPVPPVAIDRGSAAARSALAPADHPAPFAYDLQPGARVVYLIDVSGSLVDIMPHVVDWMGDALEVMPRTRGSRCCCSGRARCTRCRRRG